MTAYAIQRLLGMVPTLLMLVLLTVVLTRMMPGDIIDVLLQEQASDPAAREQLESLLGLDKNVFQAYVEYLGDVVQGDLGSSLITRRPVIDSVQDSVMITVELAIFALIIAWLLGGIIGIASAIKQDSPTDYMLRSVAIFGLVIPNFALATAVVLLPAIWWGWSPPLFYTHFADDPISHLTQFILPAVVLGASTAGSIMRITRTTMLEAFRQDYVRTARAKGVAERTVIYRHVLRNALIPLVAVFGLQTAGLLSGTVIIENVFALPGMGRLLFNAVAARDYPIIQGVTLLIGTFVIIVNLIVDLSYVLIDPRVKLGGGTAE